MRISDWSSDVCSSDLLVDIDAVSQSDVDQLRAKQQAAQAALAGAEASVRARALDISFTQVRAPIGGRSEERRVGKALSGRVGLGGSRIIKKTKQICLLIFY